MLFQRSLARDATTSTLNLLFCALALNPMNIKAVKMSSETFLSIGVHIRWITYRLSKANKLLIPERFLKYCIKLMIFDFERRLLIKPAYGRNSISLRSFISMNSQTFYRFPRKRLYLSSKHLLITIKYLNLP